MENNNQKMYFADLHIHSRFSRACSKDITIENLEKWARIKGIDLLGTGDFTHEKWLEEIKEKLKDNGKGIFETEAGFKFILTGEISLMYTQGRGRRVHLVLLAPNLEAIGKINSWLDTKGRRDYDGRPIFKISCEDFAAKMNLIDKRIEVIPGHCWTPYFGVFGSKSGFDSLKEAFGSQFENIHAIETGMSSDPEMNWRISELNKKAIVSFSDSHSFWPFRLGREATIFKSIESYDEIIREIRENDFFGTVETDPAYGKYHYDGHADCKFSSSFEETKKLNGICPVCGKPLTVGVESRVEEIGDQKSGGNPNRKRFYKILPLHEIISLCYGSSLQGKKTWAVYDKIIENFGNEFNILLEVSGEEMIKRDVDEKLVELILINRKGKIKVKPGYDGLYGVAEMGGKQGKLF